MFPEQYPHEHETHMAALFPVFMALSFAPQDEHHASLYELRVRTGSSTTSRANFLSMSMPEQTGTEWAARTGKDDIAHTLRQVHTHVVALLYMLTYQKKLQ